MDGPNNDYRPNSTTPPTNGHHFECGQCGKCFKQSSTLPTHLLIHSEPRPWSLTAEQGNLWPTLTNLDPSEEVRFLRARIAKLERLQAMNLPASSRAGLDFVAQNKNGLMAAHHHSHAAAAGCGVAIGMLQHPQQQQQQQQQQHQQNAAMLQHLQQQQQQNAAFIAHPMAAAFAAQVQLAAAAQQQHLQHNAAGAGAVTAPVVTAAACMSANALLANQQQVAAVLANAIKQLQKQQDLLSAEQTMLKARRDALICSQLEKTASAGPTGSTQHFLLQQPAKLGASHSLQMSQFARPSTSANSQRRPRTRGGRKYQERKAKAMRIQAELAVVQNEDVVRTTSYLQKKRCFFARCAEKKKAAKAARAAKKAMSANFFGRE